MAHLARRENRPRHPVVRHGRKRVHVERLDLSDQRGKRDVLDPLVVREEPLKLFEVGLGRVVGRRVRRHKFPLGTL